MGNCQAVDPAAATVEYPTGKVEKLYFSLSARQLMLQHPGHYVALLPPPPPPSANEGSLMKRKLKLLPPDAVLNVGFCYRLVSFEDVLSELCEKGTMARHASRREPYSNIAPHNQFSSEQAPSIPKQQSAGNPPFKHMKQLRALLTKAVKEDTVDGLYPNPARSLSQMHSMHPTQRGGAWRPSLQSIAERGR